MSEGLHNLRCRVCGGTSARLREGQESVARISGKGHIDCPSVHSQYRHLTPPENSALRKVSRESDSP